MKDSLKDFFSFPILSRLSALGISGVTITCDLVSRGGCGGVEDEDDYRDTSHLKSETPERFRWGY